MPRTARERISAALPDRRTVIAGAAMWAATMAVSALTGLLARGWKTPSDIASVLSVFAAGAGIAFPLAFVTAELISGARRESRLAAAMLAFTLGTAGFTALIYALEYREYYADWHADAFTWIWANQFAYTTAGALLQFAVSGVPLYFPIGFVALIAVSVWFARRPH